MKNLLFFVSAIIISAGAFAQSSSELREKAKKEAEVDVKKQMNSASDAQVSGILVLQDPYREEMRRSWKWYFGLQAQKLSPTGSANITGLTTENLDNVGSTILPFVNFGLIKDLTTTGQWGWAWGLNAQAGLSSQKVDLTLPSGYKPQNARLNTSILKAGPFVSLKNAKLNWLALTLGPQIGTLAYTQTSQDGVANFAETSALLGYNVGLNFDLNKDWQLNVENQKTQLTNSADKTISIQNDSYTFGARILW